MPARHVSTPLRYFQKLHHEPLKRFPIGWFWFDHTPVLYYRYRFISRHSSEPNFRTKSNRRCPSDRFHSTDSGTWRLIALTAEFRLSDL